MKEEFYTVPILFIIFNRFSETKEVFERIRLRKPINLYIAADGPRENIEGEREICNAIKLWVIQNIDWNCTIYTLFRDKNLGCGKAPAQAITWFFEQVEEGVILEDDCVPNDSFFTFCRDLLVRYRYNQRVSAISGNNFHYNQPMVLEPDYYFSSFPSSWGWATWRRAWLGFDIAITSWNSIKNKTVLRSTFKEKKYYLWWEQKFNWIYTEQPQDMWDFQFHFHSMMKKQLAIIPRVNLVSNIGHGINATHFHNPDSYIANIPTYELIFPLKHPSIIIRNYDADVYVQKMIFGESEIVSFSSRLKRFVKRVLIIIQ